MPGKLENLGCVRQPFWLVFQKQKTGKLVWHDHFLINTKKFLEQNISILPSFGNKTGELL